MNEDLLIFQNNINGYYSSSEVLETNLHTSQPHICLLQECFRSENKSINYQRIKDRYNQFWSETGRTGILVRRDINVVQRKFVTEQDKFHTSGYESCWVEISYLGESKPIMFCSLYRNIQKTKVK